jgi:catechol 2,3-dioxygenase-like lactoylglutathione lyase family enzyme
MLLNQINLIVKDMSAAIAFYRRLGLQFDAEPGANHVEIYFPNKMSIELDSMKSVEKWNTGWRGPAGTGNVIGFAVESREEVDTIYSDLTAEGYRGSQPPFDAFWGARYAVVEDPDGNGIGLTSPIDSARKFWPPSQPPAP